MISPVKSWPEIGCRAIFEIGSESENPFGQTESYTEGYMA